MITKGMLSRNPRPMILSMN
nr:hypothetical protein [Tanacetum cinerariifolium]